MPGTNLTRVEAEARARDITAPSYAVELDLTSSTTTFDVVTTITFSASPGASTFIDFVGDSVRQVSVNGEAREAAYDGSRIAIDDLGEHNEVRIEATANFTNTGEGLHRFVDPADGEVYLYSQFEVPHCRRMFPVFEQPDLKAEFAFTITAPSHWQVLSNSPTPEPEPTGRDGVSTWRFAPTAPISSYVTALVAGPYDVIRDSVKTKTKDVPLGLFCRKSLTPHLDADNFFAVTKAGFAFFEEEFDYPYPFEKYDQIFTPEYNMGAMENVGCVTFNEVYIFRSKVSEALVERRATTVLHELAHMWFGNLVTMKWWNDLWLNESFAEWAATTALAESTHWSDAWTTFTITEKDWAYDQDQLTSTHPIVAPIRDLEDVEVNFDGITYAKGGSVLKQLVAYVGRDAFRDGLRAYFRAHEWSNTTLADLLAALETTSGRDLRAWSALWLETAGVATLRAEIEVDDQGLISSAAITQTCAEGFETLRPHRLALGLYAARSSDDGATHLERVDRIELDVTGERTEVRELLGREQPDLLLVNDDDLAYAKIRLDARSLASALEHGSHFTDSLPKALVLGSLWDMTRDAEMGARDFISVALDALDGESNSTLVRSLLTHIATSVRLYVAPDHREATRQSTLDRLWQAARSAAPSSDAQFQLVTAAAAMTAAGDDTAYLRGLFDGNEQLDGLTVDTDMRWTLLTGLAASGGADPDEIGAEEQRDQTVTGREKAARARAAIPTPEAKAAAWRAAVDESTLSNSMVEETGLGFSRAGDPSVLQPYVARYHEMLDTVQDKGSTAIIERIVEGFYPRALASAELSDASAHWLATHDDAPDALRRLVSENRDGIVRALAAQERDAQT